MSVMGSGQLLKSSLPPVRMLPLALLRSLSQIFFIPHAVSGLFFLAALASYDWRMALLVLFGVAVAVGTAALVGMPSTALQSGAHGFCAALISAAAYVSLGPSWLALLVSSLGSVSSILITAVLNRLFSSSALRQFRLPYLTAPFCIVSGIALVLTTDTTSTPTTSAVFEGPRLVHTGDIVLSSLSQVLLVDDVFAGILVLAGLFLAQWKLGAAALLGATAGPASAYLLGQQQSLILQGLAGYNAVLVSVALAAIFISGTWQPWAWALAGLLLLIPVTGIISALPIPGFTWPFIVTTWIMLALASVVPGVRRTQEAAQN